MKEKNIMMNKVTKITLSTILLLIVIVMQIMSFPKEVTATEDYKGFKMTLEPVTTLNAGDTVKLKISTDGEPIQSIDAYFEYDFSIFEQITENDITLLAKDWQVDSIEYDEEIHGDNTAYIIISNNKTNVNTGDIAIITLTLKKTIKETSVTLYDTYVVKEDFTSVGPLEGITVEIREPERYQIIYEENTNDTVREMPVDEEKIEDKDYTIKGTPIREKYTFKGWNTSEDGNGTTYNVGDIYNTNSNLTLYAQWEKILVETTLTVNPNGGVWEGSSNIQTFKQLEETTKEISNPTSTPNGNIIKLNSNGGQVETLQLNQTTRFDGWTGAELNGTTYTFGTEDATITANYSGNSVTLPKATKIGSKFLGWYDLEDNYIGKEGESYNPKITTPNAIITLTAKYEAETYTLTINPNGGKYEGNTQNVTIQGQYNEEKAISEPIKDGYKVTLDNNDGTGTTSELTQKNTFTEWTIVSGNGTINGTTYKFGTENGEIKANYIEETVELPTLTREGYTFKGWYTSKNEGTKVNDSYKPTEDITLYARWEVNKYTITFNPDGGELLSTEKTKEVLYGQPYGELPTPTKIGNIFKGWYNSKEEKIESTTIVNITDDETLVAKWESEVYTLTINPNGGKYEGNTQNVTIQGQYNEEKTISDPIKEGYKVTLDHNDGTETTTEITQKYTFAGWEIIAGNGIINDKIYTFGTENGEIKANYTEETIELPILTREGYTFKGWFTSKNEENKIENPYKPTEDITLYAGWERNTYIITFEPRQDVNMEEKTREIGYGEAYGVLPVLEKIGYTFKGWSTTEEATEPDCHPEDIFLQNTDITLYGIWEEKIYLKSTQYLIGTGVNPAGTWSVGELSEYEEGDIYIKGIRPQAGLREYPQMTPPNLGTKLDEFLSNLDTNADEIKVYIPEKDSDGNVILKEENLVENNQLVATAMVIKLTKGEQEIQLTLIVRGDVISTGKTVGDGKVTNVEAARLKTLSATTLTKNYTIEEQQAIDFDINTSIRWSTNKQKIISTYQNCRIP